MSYSFYRHLLIFIKYGDVAEGSYDEPRILESAFILLFLLGPRFFFLFVDIFRKDTHPFSPPGVLLIEFNLFVEVLVQPGSADHAGYDAVEVHVCHLREMIG